MMYFDICSIRGLTNVLDNVIKVKYYRIEEYNNALKVYVNKEAKDEVDHVLANHCSIALWYDMNSFSLWTFIKNGFKKHKVVNKQTERLN